MLRGVLYNAKVDSDVWSQARHCAHSAGGDVFGRDVHRFHCFESLICAAFALKQLDVATHKPGVKYVDRACSVQNCKVIRSFINASNDFHESISHAEESLTREAAELNADTFRFNCNALQGKFIWSSIRSFFCRCQH